MFTSSASNRLIKLIVLVSKRLNPKELWLGLDSVVETSRVGLEALAEGLDYAELSDEEGADDEESNAKIQNEDLMQDSPEHISIYLSRALLAIQIGMPG